MDHDFAAIVGYPCPRCGIGLEARSVPSPDWLRCPGCGKGSLPPFPSTRTRPRAIPAKVSYDPDVHVIGEEVLAEPAMPWFGSRRDDQIGAGDRPEPGFTSSTAGRTLLTIVFSLCLSLFCVTLFLGENFGAGLAGIVAGIILLFLVRPAPPATRR